LDWDTIKNDALESSILLGACKKRTTLLPRPLGLVKDLNRYKNDLAYLSNDGLCRFLDDHGAMLGPLRAFILEDTTPLFIVVSVLIFSLGLGGAHDSAGDHLNHLVSELTKSAASPSTTAATSATTSWEVFGLRFLFNFFSFFGLVNGR
jgi:hypothetical protein